MGEAWTSTLAVGSNLVDRLETPGKGDRRDSDAVDSESGGQAVTVTEIKTAE